MLKNEAARGLPPPGHVIGLDEDREDAAERSTTREDSMDSPTRRAALALLSQGKATLSEVAAVAGVSRQLVRYWANVAKLDWQKCRDTEVARLWRNEIKRRER